MIPFKKVFAATNDFNILGVTFNDLESECHLLSKAPDRFYDCYNCIVTTLKNAVNDPLISDDDVILFKHESVFINDIHLVKKCIEKILSGYNMVTRSFFGKICTDAFFIKVSSVRELVQTMSMVTQPFYNFSLDSFSTGHLEKNFNFFCAETLFMTNIEKIPNVHTIMVCSTLLRDPNNYCPWGCIQLGLYHIPCWRPLDPKKRAFNLKW